jgi:hypothetical protein
MRRTPQLRRTPELDGVVLYLQTEDNDLIVELEGRESHKNTGGRGVVLVLEEEDGMVARWYMRRRCCLGRGTGGDWASQHFSMERHTETGKGRMPSNV